MRIAFIGQKGVVLGARAGGVERHVAELGPRLVRAGNEVLVYARRRYDYGRPRTVEGMRVFYPPTIYTKHLEAIVHVLCSTLHALTQKVDVFHYQGVGPSLLSWIPRIVRPRATVIVTFHARDQFHSKWGYVAQRLLRFSEWTACRLPHATITVSHQLQVFCRQTYRIQPIFIPNGAYVKEVTASDQLRAFGVKPQEYVLTVGRLLAVKGFQYLIPAFRRLRTTKQLLIVGAQNEQDDYVKRLAHLAQGDARIRFLGFQSGEALAQLYAHAYVYCQPSESEGMPLAVLEAMGYGTAVLVSDIPGNVEAIHHAGFTFQNQDIDDLAVQLQYVLTHEADVQRARKDVRQIIQNNFDWDVIAQQTLQVYRTMRH